MARHSNTWAYDWVYTFNGTPNRVDWEQFVVDLASVVDSGEVYYVCGQAEEGEQTRRRHYQIFIQYRKRQRGGRIVQLLRGVADQRYSRDCAPHAEPRYGSVEQAVQYHTKEETRVAGPFEYGVRQPVRIQFFVDEWLMEVDSIDTNNSVNNWWDIPCLFDEYVAMMYGFNNPQ